VAPSIADLYAACPIQVIVSVVGVVAAALHAEPC
jgi:hypothetical protein